ncbi:hypothetical protein CFB81_00040 [Burkholderia sp. AU28863]|nr:hypothetical protein CFB81_00040 [Burkholderia sp. AU28863]
MWEHVHGIEIATLDGMSSGKAINPAIEGHDEIEAGRGRHKRYPQPEALMEPLVCHRHGFDDANPLGTSMKDVVFPETGEILSVCLTR